MKKICELAKDHSYAQLPEGFFQNVRPTGIDQPFLIDFNESAAKLIDLSPAEQDDADFIDYMSGNQLIPDSQPIATVYSGHQFGQYSPQLGDGRAILLTEILNEDSSRWDIQLKGAGSTAFSRQGDGRAVLRSSIREYLCGEAMHNLGIPTSRALCLIGSQTAVYREKIETAATLARMAPSHVRFGTFEYFYYTRQHNSLDQLMNYIINLHYPALSELPDKHHQLLTQVVERTAKLIAQWQVAGFAHGVMNTDNMSILGITLDYGPFGFLDNYNPGYICNHSDHQGRYAYNQQPNIGLWNLACLAETFANKVPIDDAKGILGGYEQVYANKFIDLMLTKLGFQEYNEQHLQIIKDLLLLLENNQTDYTIFFRQLSSAATDTPTENKVRDLFINREEFDHWFKDYAAALRKEHLLPAERQRQMKKVNPKYILRNHLAQLVIEAAEKGNFQPLKDLKNVLDTPFDEHPAHKHYADLPPDWANKLEISCSS